MPMARLRRENRAGAAAAEFAIVLPVLALIVLGCIDFGRFAYVLVAVNNAARTGAEYGSTHPYLSSGQSAWMAQIQQTARDEMTQQTGYNSNNLTTTTTVTVEGTGLHRVRVVAAYDSFQTVISWPGIPNSVVVQRAVEMRAIR